MRFKISLLLLLALVASVLPLAAQESSSGLVAITDSSHVVLFTNTETTVLADVPAPLPVEVIDAEFSYTVSNDNQWVLQSSYWPAVIAYGRVGQSMSVVPLDDKTMNYRVLSAVFSPDNRYLVFTVAVEFRWVLGFVNLESGELSSLEGQFASIEPDLSPDLPFGNMVPTTPWWSADGTRLYLETLVPFWGCRGPHDLYAIDMSDVKFSSSMPLPSTVEIARQGTDLYGYAFSQDGRYLAYTFEDESCGYMGERGVALMDLASDTDQVLVKPSESGYVSLIGWLQENTLLYSRSVASEIGMSVPTLYVYDREQDQSVELPPMIKESGITVTQIEAKGESLFFSVAAQETYNPSYPTTLFHRLLNEAESHEIADGVFDWAVCGDSLYFVTATQGSSMTLFSKPLSSLTEDPLELGTVKTIHFLSCSTAETQS